MDGLLRRNDPSFLRRAIELAYEAERSGNLPVGAVICLKDEVVAQGKNSIWAPMFEADRHAEIEALRAVPQELWARSREMTLYTTLEPCLMCAGAILLHRFGRVVFGSSDGHGGAGCVFDHMPPYFRTELSKVQWIGPALPEECDPLYERVLALIEQRRRRDAGP